LLVTAFSTFLLNVFGIEKGTRASKYEYEERKIRKKKNARNKH
jgi:hypothetical protein